MQGRRAADDPAQLCAPTRDPQLRDLTRYRADLVAARTAEKNRAEKLLEDAQIKLSVVVSDIIRVCMAALLLPYPSQARSGHGSFFVPNYDRVSCCW